MTAPPPGLDTLPHAVFLRRLAHASRGTSLEAELSRGAFLTLRLVDLLGPERDTLHPDAFHYQQTATGRACRGLPAHEPEASHLHGLIESTASAFQARDNQLIVPGLFAYAHYLEDEMRLEQALDVLETLDRVVGDALRPADRVAMRLRFARVFRKLSRFDDAEGAYAQAGALATVAGDCHSELLSRIGQGITLTSRGNLRGAEQFLRATLADAERLCDTAARARAHQALAVALSTSGRLADAAPHQWRAYQLYDDDDMSRLRVLSDLGVTLLGLGDVDAAERALSEILRQHAARDVEDNALIELMHCASYRRDRVGFERWRERCEARRTDMAPNILVDYWFKLGIGRARFGQYNRAESALTKAQRLAEGARLHEAVFRIERIMTGFRACNEQCDPALELDAELECRTEAVREVSASLAEFGR
ncbi:MAG TPA: hypothetical protein VM736_10670 [Gemmatimonadales bacterium]|nr:hypothetical protein [Gemmatimonadales bacterium]